MTAYTFDQLITFTRTSGGGYFGPDGLFRFTPASRNLLLYTQDFNVSTWSKAATVAYPFDPATATYGPELTVNGSFVDGTTGWRAVDSTIAIVGGQLEVTQAGPSPRAETFTAISTGIGTSYYVTAQMRVGTASSVAVTAREGSGAFGTLASVSSTSATMTTIGFYFTATTATTLIQMTVPNVAGVTGYFDNISVREVTTLGLLAPDGTLTADAVLPTATTAAHNVQQAGGGSGTPLTLSVYAKAGSHAFMQLSHGSLSSIYANFNLLTGEVGTVGANATASITPAGDGWYRCAMTFTPGGAANLAIGHITSTTAGHRESWAATGTESIYLWGSQLEAVPDANLVLGPERVSSPTITAINANGTVSVVGDTVTCTCTTAGLFGFTIAGLTAVVGQSYRLSANLLTNSASRLMFADIGGYTIGFGTATGAIVRASANATTTSAYGLYATSGQIGDTFSVSLSSLSVRQITSITGMPSTYTRNVGGLYPPRFDYDPVTLAPRGLLIEEQRTNLLLRSEEFENATWVKASATVAANAAVSPDGAADADKIIVNNGVTMGSGSAAGIRQINAKAAIAITYSYTAFIKAGEFDSAFLFMANAATTASARCSFNLATGTASATFTTGAFTAATASITACGGGWYRCNLTATSDTAADLRCDIWPADTVATLGDGTSGIYLWGAQLEAGAFPTSYIPTVASQVTRAADNAVITGANFSQWYNQSEGTFVVEADTVVPTSTSVFRSVGVTDGSTNNTIAMFVYNGRWGGSLAVGGVNQADLQVSGSYTPGVSAKSAFAYKVNDVAFSANGSAALTDTAASIPVVDRLAVGSLGPAAGGTLNGHIRRIRYYPTRLSNAQLQTLTA